MEKHLTKKVDQHQVEFKTAIKKWFETNSATISSTGQNMNSEFMQYIFDYSCMSFNKEDFQKRKRVKNTVPHFERCSAKRADGEQCTRRKKEDNALCGTHVKGLPHGVVSSDSETTTKAITKIEIWHQEIKGIIYYIDMNNNVYKPEDIISNKPSPAIIAKWALTEQGVYTIPAFSI
jgi:hypothetical protein